MIDLTPLFEAIISLLAAIITVYVIPAIRAKTDAEQRKRIEAAVAIGVYAAEKLYESGEGDLKFQYVEGYLLSKGIKLNRSELVAQINAAIKGMELTELTVYEEPTEEEEDE